MIHSYPEKSREIKRIEKQITNIEMATNAYRPEQNPKNFSDFFFFFRFPFRFYINGNIYMWQVVSWNRSDTITKTRLILKVISMDTDVFIRETEERRAGVLWGGALAK